MEEKHYLTAEKLEALKQELLQLKTVRRIEVADRLRRAKELGDLSENSEYQEAREEQGIVEIRIGELEEIVKNVEIIKKGVTKGTIIIGSTVKAKKDGKEFTFTIVGANEACPEEGFISNESPLGRSFLNKKAGDEVLFKAPAGEMSYSIISVK